MAKANPIVPILVGSLIGGLPDLIGGIVEKSKARKAEKLARAGTEQIIGAVGMGAVVENPALLQQLMNAGTDGGIYLPAELVELPLGFTIAYIALAVCGLGLKAYAKHVAGQVTPEDK